MKNIVKALRLVIPLEPLRMSVYLLLSLPGAVLPAAMLHLQRRLVDRAAQAGAGQPLWYYMQPVLLLIAAYMALKLFDLLSKQYMEFGYFRYVFMRLDARIHEKSARISLEYYDNAQYYQMIQNAKQASMFLVFTANLAIMSLVLICNLLSVGGYLTALHPLLLVFVLLVSAPVVIEKVKGAKYQSELLQDTVQARRRKSYAFGLLSAAECKKEIAHHGSGGYVADKYLEACAENDVKERRCIGQTARNALAFGGIKALLHGGAVFMMVWLLVTGRITVGGFSVLLTSFATLTGAFTQLFHHAGEILQTGVMSEAFFTLMQLQTRDGAKKMPPADYVEDGTGSRKEIARLEQVFYHYPNAEDFALKDISLSVKKGERIAIVGENGAGKTTLAKLLSGFLVPTQGSLTLGGIPRGELMEDSCFTQISAVYQEFGRYKLTLAQNVYLGDAMDDRGTVKPMDGGRIRRSLEWAGVLLSDKPEELILGREFGGTELSGGQWQRLALARCYYRQRPILFFDEPTAAIDPLEETALYGKLEELAGDRTVIMVTHRLGAARSADRIIVLEDGGIAEQGSFAELTAQKGRFYHIWNEQAKWYQA